MFPCVGLIVSGGHSNLYRCESPTDFTPLGGTIDDAAGEAFDKVASLLGLPYPGGPAIEKAARDGDPRKRSASRGRCWTTRSRLDFSFSGLKTAVRYLVDGAGKQGAGSRASSDSEPNVADMAASFQEAVDRLPCRARRSWRLSEPVTALLCVGGGVAANQRFRDAAGSSRRPSMATSCTCRRCRCAPITR